MKKLLYLVIIVGIALGGRYIYKSFTAPAVIDVQLTDEVEEVEIEDDTEVVKGPSVEEMKNFDANEVPMAEGSDTNEEETMDTVKEIIDERNKQTKDDSKLTEEDIDLMEKIIQKVEELGK